MRKYFLLIILTLFIVPSLVFAGGPFVVNDNGEAATWDTSSDIDYNPESGTCATFSNGEMLTKIDTNISFWSDITNVSIVFNEVTGSLGDVDSSNFNDFFVDSAGDPGLTDGFNPVIFDDDGEIVADLFGSANRFVVLGFAGPDGFLDNFATIVDGQAVFNCFCLAGNPSDPGGLCAAAGVTFREADLDFTMEHEFGHFLGFDHSQVNEDLAESGCDTGDSLLVKNGVKFVGGGDCDDVPSMYPQSIDPEDQITPARDDEVIALTLYGDSGWDDSLCTVTGVLEDNSGDALRCADLQAITSDITDTISVVSGAFAPAEDTNGDGFTDGASECLSDCGQFTLRGLDPAKSYDITVKPIDPRWVGGSSISPCGNGQLTGIVEEVIATVSGCTTGFSNATDLGTVTTSSTGGVTAGDGGSGSGGSGSSGTSVGCSLSSSSSVSDSFAIIFMFGFVFAVVWIKRRFVRG